jgi:hypothetical protein
MHNAMIDDARRTRPTSSTCFSGAGAGAAEHRGGGRESLLGMILHNGGSRASPGDEAKERALACASQENLGLQECVSQFRSGRQAPRTPRAPRTPAAHAHVAGRGEQLEPLNGTCPLPGTCRQAHVENAQTGIQWAQECVDGGADGVWREEETGRGFTQLNIALDISNEENDIERTHSVHGEHIIETGRGFTQLNIALDISNVSAEEDEWDGAEEKEEEEAAGNRRLNDSKGACEEQAFMFARYTSKDFDGESAVGNMEASSSHSLNEALDVSDVVSDLNGYA